MADVQLILLLTVICIVALASVLAWSFGRLLRPDYEPSGVDPILGARDHVAVYRPSGTLIQPHPSVLVPLPEHLTTQEEMVAWMTKEMPKVVERAVRQ